MMNSCLVNFGEILGYGAFPSDINNNELNRPNLNQRNVRQFDPCDLNFDALTLNGPVRNQPKSQGHLNNQSRVRDLLEATFGLSDGQKYIFCYHVHKHFCEQTRIFRQYQDVANNLSKVKNLLLMKKESAIIELLANLPFVHPGNREVKMTYLRIIPVLFSHVSLYDVCVDEILQIVDLLRIHPAFTAQQGLFAQWFALFEARRKSKKYFAFKDESYVRGLPPLPYSFSADSLTQSVGYSDIALLRAIHRWLRLHRLHKYLYFFASLSYEEMMNLDENNFEVYQEQVNLQAITIGAKHKILREIEVLRERRSSLLTLLKTPFATYDTAESKVREIKRILRTPISVRDVRNEKLPALLLEAMTKVFKFVVMQPSANEKMVAIHGLLISLLKEAWNYNIFQPEEKECFNKLRRQLIEKTDQRNANAFSTSGKRVIFTDDSKLQEQTAGNTYFQCLEEVANNCAEFILKK